MYRLGLDLGSSYSKGVLVDQGDEIVETFAVKTGYSFHDAAEKLLEKLGKHGSYETPIDACGYGRDQLEIEYRPHSEIIALARAVYRLEKRAATIIDIGGQDTKYIKLTADGRVDSFKLNRKCAAGTGSFLEEIAFRLNVEPESFDELARQAEKPVQLNSYCTVFAVSEIVGLIKQGVKMPELAAGIYRSIVERVSEIGLMENEVILTGGIPEKHPALLDEFKKIHPRVKSPRRAQFMAAYGCVLKEEISDD